MYQILLNESGCIIMKKWISPVAEFFSTSWLRWDKDTDVEN